MIELNTPIEFSFELANNVTGALVTAPENMSLYVVRPGNTSAESVPADFVQVSDTAWKTTITADLVSSAGVLTAFVLATNAVSSEIGIFQIGENLPVGVPVWVPFIARNPAQVPLSGLAFNDVTLTTHITSGSSRSLVTEEFVQLQDVLATTLPIYLMQIREEEVNAEGVLTYEAEASSMTAFVKDLLVGEPENFVFTVKLDPFLAGVDVQFIQNGETVAQVTTNGVGEAPASLPQGSYVVRLSKSGHTFSTNNVAVDFPESLDGSEGLLLLDGSSTTDPAPASGFCRIFFRLLKPTGEPEKGRKVLFVPKLAVSGTGEGVIKQSLEVISDPNGAGEINLIHGLEMVVNVEGTRLFEEFTVPAQSEEDLFNLISFEDKGFGFYIANFPSGIRRTLNP